MVRLTGIGASRGIAIGQLHYFNNVPDRVEPRKTENAQSERLHFEEARRLAIDTLKQIHQRALKEVGPDESLIFEIHQMMLEDADYTRTVLSLIEDSHYTAEYAVQQAGEKFARVFSDMDDAYLKERHADVWDISNRILHILAGKNEANPSDIGGQFIIAAKSLMPSETIQMDQGKVLAIVTCDGSRISHSAILARTMGIPAVVALGEEQYNKLNDRSTIIVDGTSGSVVIDPDERTLVSYRWLRQEYLEYRQRLKTMKGAKSVTLDGTQVHIYADVLHLTEVETALENDAQGIGVMHSEFLFLESENFPSEQKQFETYKAVLRGMEGKRIIVRTLDLSEKMELPYFSLPPENNPMMGCHGIRLSLRYPEILYRQFRAILRASVFGDLLILLPLVNSAAEVQAARGMLRECMSTLEQEGTLFNRHIKLGILLETPAAALSGEELAAEADFFMIHADHLTQYALGVDKSNSKIGSMYDPHSPAVLRLIEAAAKSAVRKSIPCGICGRPAADCGLTERFLRMGITAFAVESSAVLAVREKVRSIRLVKLPAVP